MYLMSSARVTYNSFDSVRPEVIAAGFKRVLCPQGASSHSTEFVPKCLHCAVQVTCRHVGPAVHIEGKHEKE